MTAAALCLAIVAMIATQCESGDDADPTNPPRAVGYRLRRVMHLEGP